MRFGQRAWMMIVAVFSGRLSDKGALSRKLHQTLRKSMPAAEEMNVALPDQP